MATSDLDPDARTLAAGYLHYARLLDDDPDTAMGSDPEDPDCLAYLEVDRTIRYGSAERGWELVIEILRQVADDELETQGAEPLEDLVRWHGIALIDEIEHEAKRDERFKRALDRVGLDVDDLPPDILERVVRASGNRITPTGPRPGASSVGDDDGGAAIEDAINRAFADTPAPKADHIAPHECPECTELREAFAGVDWRSMAPALIRRHESSLPLLTPEAFAYYLPAYLLYGLRRPDALATDLMVYTLTPGLRQGDATRAEWHEEQLSRLTGDQLDVVITFLRFLAEQPAGRRSAREATLACDQLTRYRAARA